MEPTAKILAQNNSVCVPNMLGHGLSATPDHALNIEEHAAALSEFLKAAGFTNPVLVGGSYGCNISAELAAMPIVDAKGLVLIGTTDVRGKSVQELMGKLMKDVYSSRQSWCRL